MTNVHSRFIPLVMQGRLVLPFGILKTKLAVAVGSGSVDIDTNYCVKQVSITRFIQMLLLLPTASAYCLLLIVRTNRPCLSCAPLYANKKASIASYRGPKITKQNKLWENS